MTTLDAELLVPLITIPIWTVGFAIVGYFGYRDRDDESKSNRLEGIFNPGVLPRAKTVETPENGGAKKNPLEISTRTSVYFHTDSVMWEPTRSCCSPEMQKIMWDVYAILIFYSIPILSMLDHVSDMSMVVLFLRQSHLKHLGFISLFIILFQRITSALILGDQYGWKKGILQFFDLEMFVAVYNSIKHERTVLELVQLKLLEGILESFPELVIQSYYFVALSQGAERSWLVYISLTLSMLSLSKCWLFSDQVAIPYDGFSCCKEEESVNMPTLTPENEDEETSYYNGLQ
jgi:hypothetical protein